MIVVTNRERYPDITFDQYLSLPHVSNSYIKSNINGVIPEFIGSEKVELGSMVDAMLTDAKASKAIDRANPLFKQARTIADKITTQFGSILAATEKQVAITATVSYEGFSLNMKTLIDFVIPNRATIELKVTSVALSKVETLIDFMGYDNQVFLERTLCGVGMGYLLVYSTKDKKAIMMPRKCDGSEAWLADKVMEYGSVTANTII